MSEGGFAEEMLIEGQTTSLPAPGNRLHAHRMVRDAFLVAVMFFAVFAATWQVMSAAYPDGVHLFLRHKHQLIKVDDTLAYPMPSVCWDRG